EGWALAQFTLGGGLLLLALSYRYWRARGARVLHAGKWLALLPLCLFIFPSSFGASVFLIALSTWFPVTVLTWSGVMGIDK
ncbi:ABC transporter permease, partial [Klebsiella pneumoniae]